MQETTAETIQEFILTRAVQNDQLIYSPPSRVVIELAEQNINVSRLYIIRMYYRLGIYFIGGLWVKKIGND